jgi:hypothetical protein
MIDKKKFIYKDQVTTLCNVMINAQALFDDLEDLEQEGLFKQYLKRLTKDLIAELEKSLGQIYGVGLKDIMKAIKDGKSSEELKEIRQAHRNANIDINLVYETAINSRKEYDKMSFEEKLMLTNILSELRKETKKSK